MQDKFVLWRFVGLQVMKSGRTTVQKRTHWKVYGSFKSIDDAIVCIDEVHTRSVMKMDSSWVVTHKGKVVFSDISDRGCVAGIFIDPRS